MAVAMAEESETEQTINADRIYSEEVSAAIERFPETAPRWINKSMIPLKKNRSKKWFWAQVRGAATLHITSVQRVNSQL